MATETATIDNVESVSPAPPETQDAPVEKVEVVNNGDHKTENGNGEAPANGEAPNAASTPIKNKPKRRAIIANMRAAFARLGLMSQLRAIGRRMRRAPKQKQEEKAPTATEAETKPQENGNGIIDGAALLATAPAAEEQQENKCNGHANHEECNGGAGEQEAAAQCQSSATPAVEPTPNDNNNETTEQQPAVVAQ